MTARRFRRDGSFTLACDPDTAIALFTPEGERAWVPHWTPTYLSGATDEAGAVWTTDVHGVHVLWVTAIRERRHARYARVSANGTTGLVDVRCEPEADRTRVHVSYDLTATEDAGTEALAELARGYDEMLLSWRDQATRALG
jgi:hypothetical protein